MPIVNKKEKKEMEYPDAPSGFVTLYNFKEPFMKYEKGYGYQGVLLFDGGTDKVQCHLCGEWFEALPNHIIREHSMKSGKYKEEVGLNKKTALIGEKLRAKLIASGLNKRLQNLRNQKGVKRSEETKDKIRKSRHENRREFQNQAGTCPEQLIDRMIKSYQKLGYVVSEKNCNFKESLVKTYGSYRNACKVAGIPEPRTREEVLKEGRSTSTKKSQIRRDNFIKCVLDFYDSNDRLPIKGELKGDCERIWKTIKVKQRNKIFKEVVLTHGKYSKHISGQFQFTKTELLSFLKNFEKINGRKPSYSDSRRGLLPVLSRYSYHFGSWQNALKLAFK